MNNLYLKSLSNKIRIKFKENLFGKIYEFENTLELNVSIMALNISLPLLLKCSNK